jgi:hypothetical protein
VAGGGPGVIRTTSKMSDKLKALGSGIVPMGMGGQPLSVAQIRAQKAAENAEVTPAAGEGQATGAMPTTAQPQHHPEPHGDQPVSPTGEGKKHAKAMYDSVENSESMPFKAGDVVEVMQMDGEWWWVELKGQSGYVPRDFFKLEEDDHGAKKSNPPPKADVKAPAVPTAAPVQQAKTEDEALAPGIVVGIALYDYAPPADIENSIGLKKGEKVFLDTNVLPIEENGEWLFAVSKTKQGYVPRNYVKLMK